MLSKPLFWIVLLLVVVALFFVFKDQIIKPDPKPDPNPEPVPTPPNGDKEREENHCNWPDTCDPPQTARVMLDEILMWAEEEGAKTPPHILLPDLDRIREDVPRCKKPDLTNGEGKHVCDVIDPTACDELQMPGQGIHPKAREAFDNPDPIQSQALWKACADGLDQFPGGR